MQFPPGDPPAGQPGSVSSGRIEDGIGDIETPLIRLPSDVFFKQDIEYPEITKTGRKRIDEASDDWLARALRIAVKRLALIDKRIAARRARLERLQSILWDLRGRFPRIDPERELKIRRIVREFNKIEREQWEDINAFEDEERWRRELQKEINRRRKQ